MENLLITAPAHPSSAGAGPAALDVPADGVTELLPIEFSALLLRQIKDLIPAAATGDDPGGPAGPAASETDATHQSADPAILSGPVFALLAAASAPLPGIPAASVITGAASVITGAASAATTKGAAEDLPIVPGAGGATNGSRAAPRAGAVPGTAADLSRDMQLIAAQPATGHHESLPQLVERSTDAPLNPRDTAGPLLPQLASAHVLPAAQPTVTAATQPQIHTPFGAAGWGAELGQKVVWMINDKQQVAELRVNPPDLGPLDIKLTIDDHQTTAVFTSPHSAVREAVEAALPRLREVLAESGIMLGNASVTADSPRDGSAYTPQRPPASATAEPIVDPLSAQNQRLTTVPTRGRGLVDLFA